MKQTMILVLLCCGLLGAGSAFAEINPKLTSAIAEARKVGISKSALNIFLSQTEGARFSVGIIKDILKDATETQKAGAPGDQLLLKASEGVAKRIDHMRIAGTVHKLGLELQQIAKTLPKTVPASARKKLIMEKFRAAHPTPDKK